MATKKTGASKPVVSGDAVEGASLAPEQAAETPKSKTKKAKKGDDAQSSAPATVDTEGPMSGHPTMLANGRLVDFVSVRKAIKVYSPKAKVPADDAAALALLRKVVAARLAEIPPDDHMLCGEQDDEKTGCREMATGDVSFCPFCGDEGVPEDEAPPSPGVVDAEPVNATEAGLVAMKSELDEAVTRFEGLRRDLVANAYDIGLTLRDIRDRDLWKASGASSLKDFMERELGISRTSGYRYMALTEEYDRQTFLEIGPRKLSLISGIESKDDRDAALEAAKAGASARDVEALVKPERGKGEAPAKERAGKSSTPKPKGGAEITLLAKVNGKPTSIPFRGAESGRPLKHYKPGAYGEFQISDDVVLRVGFKDDKEGNHEAITIAFVRAE